MKILHLIDIPWWSGLSAYAFDCIEAHKSLGHDIRLLCEADSLPYKRARAQGIAVSAMGGRHPWEQIVNFFVLGTILSSDRPDLIVAHTGSTHWMSVLFGKILGIPVIRTRAIARNVKSGALSSAVYENTKWVAAASENLKRDLEAKLPQPLSGRFQVLMPPVANPSSSLSLPANKKIGVLARLDPKKGHFQILEAVKILQKTHPDCELYIAGAEENLLWSELARHAGTLGIKNIRYHGFLEYDQIWNFMKDCRIGLIGSLESEEVSRALLEWMSAGRPVVSTRVGCIPSILDEGRGGFIVDPGNAEQTAQKISTILAQPDLAITMGRYNSEIAAKKYSRDIFRSSWQKLLEH